MLVETGTPTLPQTHLHNLYREIMMHSSEAVAIIDTRGIYVEQNPAHRALVGYADEEIRGQTPAIHLGQEVFDEIARSLAESGHYQGEVVSRTKDGAMLDVELSAFTLFDGSGAPVCHVGIKRDITKRKHEEESTLRLAAIVESSDDAIISKNLDGIILSWNEGAEKIFGYKPDEAIGKHVSILIPPERFDEEPHIIETIRSGNRIDHYETIRVRKDGRRINISLTVSPVKDSRGRVIGVSKIARDITERVRAEEERARLLEREREARERAEEAGRLKDQFLATVSHELRTPLTAILGWTHLMRSGEFDPAGMLHGLEVIERNARAQTQLIDDLLDVSRIVSGKMHLDLRPLDPNTSIEAAVEALRPTAEARGVTLRNVTDAGVGLVSGDAARLQQVVWNLLSNAIKFTPAGGLVEVRLENERGHARITVRDTGEGIAPDFLPFVFDRFRQADGTTTRRHGGLGLGLSIVRHLVELHGGTVTAASEGKGRGATFTVTLPLLQKRGEGHASHEGFGVAGHEAANGTQRLSPFEGMSILVVDDEEDTRELLCVLLAKFGANVRAAASADEALEMFRMARPDLLVCDIGMPGRDGYELLREVRSMPREEGGRVPAVALTAYARPEDRLRSLQAGYQMHVAKPVEIQELVAVISSLVERA